MKAACYISLLAVLLLNSFATAQVTRLEDRHCQFTLPSGWKVAPQAALDTVNEHARRIQLNIQYDLMLVPHPTTGETPYALVQFIPAPMDKATHEDLKQFVTSMTGKKVQEAMKDKLDAANLSGFSMNDAALDLSNYRYFTTADIAMPDGGRLVTLMSGTIGTKGVVHLLTYSLPTQVETVRPIHDQLANSFTFDPGFAYTPAVAAAAEQSRSGMNWSGVAAKAAIGAAVGLVVGVIGWLKRRHAA